METQTKLLLVCIFFAVGSCVVAMVGGSLIDTEWSPTLYYNGDTETAALGMTRTLHDKTKITLSITEDVLSTELALPSNKKMGITLTFTDGSSTFKIWYKLVEEKMTFTFLPMDEWTLAIELDKT
ncbi:MAG: hypothetical protein ACFFDN_15935 [Candidatus Hodarchaeota archaeon]